MGNCLQNGRITYFLKLILFIYSYLWLFWVFGALHGLSLVAVRRGYFVAVCGLLIATASLVEHRLWGALAGSVVKKLPAMQEMQNLLHCRFSP